MSAFCSATGWSRDHFNRCVLIGISKSSIGERVHFWVYVLALQAPHRRKLVCHIIKGIYQLKTWFYISCIVYTVSSFRTVVPREQIVDSSSVRPLVCELLQVCEKFPILSSQIIFLNLPSSKPSSNFAEQSNQVGGPSTRIMANMANFRNGQKHMIC